MKQVLQDLKTGAVVVTDTPEPTPARGRVLVKVHASLLSAGTESAMVAQASQSLLDRVRSKPELLRKAFAELKGGGLAGLQEKIASKYEGYLELGYCCAGAVVHSGEETGGLSTGTLVTCAGYGAASHAEYVSVPHLLTAVVPEGVSAEAAAYTTVGAIAMQGVRQAQAQLGEYVAVIGLGLVGLLTAQLLRAAGCRVAGIDPSESARQRALVNGCEVVAEPVQALEAVRQLSGGLGADAVIICAASSSSQPVELAGTLCRSRGRVTMVGATGMTIPREEYFAKELSFTLSRSYGPGRYDPTYESAGIDYPVAYVRFTEQRNMRAFLELAQQGRIQPQLLTTHRFPVEEGPAAFALLNDQTANRAGVILTYKADTQPPSVFRIALKAPEKTDALSVGFIGAGNYARAILLPLLRRRKDVNLRSVANRNGSQALHAARRFGFENACTDPGDILGDENVKVVFITTRHDSHARLTCEALRAGKHVWVEKPLSLDLAGLREVAKTLAESPGLRLAVGFNRPFSRSAAWLRSKIGGAGPIMMNYRVNAGFLPSNSWVHDPEAGGGRLLGEGCHFFDFFASFAGARAESVHVVALETQRADLPGTGNFSATLRLQDGSLGQLLYTSQGAPSMTKEYFECFSGGVCGTIEDYRTATFYTPQKREMLPRHVQDKGQAALLDRFLASIGGGTPPFDPEHLFESSLLTLAAQQSLLSGKTVTLDDLRREFV